MEDDSLMTACSLDFKRKRLYTEMIFNILINVSVQVSLTFHVICPGATTSCKRTSTIGTLITVPTVKLDLVRKKMQEELEFKLQKR